MCGRTACTIDPAVLPYMCSFKQSDGHCVVPKFHNPNEGTSGGGYSPSTNCPPTKHLPVICSGKQLGSDDGRVICSMKWGLIPPWSQSDDPSSHGLSTSNARIESIKESKLYRPSLVNNQRCVIVCDGFYEWKRDKESKSKQPYFIYARQSETLRIEDIGQSSVKEWDEDENMWRGPKPLFMAGIYSTWKSGEKSVNSYSVITMESNETFSWLHHRIPAILSDAAAIEEWLEPDNGSVSVVDVLKPIKPDQISWHPVSTAVGNVRNQGSDLMKPVALDKTGKAIDTKSGSSKLMSAWLKRGSDAKESVQQKVLKTE